MQDRYKFRVYSPTQEVYADVESIDYAKGLVTTVCGETFKIDDVEILSCTGLKDRNGKLIYENDIVERFYICKSSIGDFTEKHLFKVVFKDYKFCLEQIEILEGNVDYSPYWDFTEALEIDEYAEHMTKITLKVIGNTFKNPDLFD